MTRATEQHPVASALEFAIPGVSDTALAGTIEVIMAGHRRLRRLSQAVDDAARRDDPAWVLAAAWQRLADMLEAHMPAGQETCYLLMSEPGLRGTGQAQEAAACRDDIRAAISAASSQRPGSAPWWSAVRAAQASIAGHLDREEHIIRARLKSTSSAPA